jgi:hypothetical protein
MATIRERLAVRKQEFHRFHMERKSSVMLRFHVGFVSLGDMDTEVDVNCTWEIVRETMKITTNDKSPLSPCEDK